jgi:hypothetical protein
MILGAPLGLLGLLGIPALVALHLWRARHAPRPVSALFLWPDDRRVLASGRRRAPLILRGSFWLEVLAVLAATWWLADIHWSPRAAARHIVAVLDDRWRLQAVADGSSAAQRLREALDARLAQLDGSDRVTLIASGSPPRILCGPAGEPVAARAALAAWRPEAAWHGMDAALTLASGIGGPGSEILLASDRAPARLPDGVGLLATGRIVTTSGLSDARWWRDGRGERIVAVVQGADGRTPVLRIAGIAISPTSTDSGVHVFAKLPPMAEDAVAELAMPGEDPLPLDDRAVLVRPPIRLVRASVSVDGATGQAVRAALTAAGATLTTGDPDLIIGAAGQPRAWSLQIVAGDGPPSLGPFTARRDHPLLADLDFSGVLWSASVAAPTGSPLLIASGQVLISESRRSVDRDLILHIDPVRSTLTRHPAWPGLFANLVAWRAARLPGVADPNPRCGQALPAMLPAGINDAELIDPAGTIRVLRAGPDGDLAIPGLGMAGRWTLRWVGGSAPISALPLDPRQADFSDAVSREIPATAAGRAEVERTRGPLAALLPLVLAAAAALAACACFAREERP